MENQGQQQLSRVRVTQADLARVLGVRRQSVNELVKRGVLRLGGDMRIDLDEARAACASHLRPDAKTAQAVGVDGGGEDQDAGEDLEALTFQAAKTRRELAEAALAERKLAQLSGELLPREAAERAIFEIGRQVRDGLEVMRRRLAPQLAAMSSVDDCDALLAREHRELLHALSKSMAKIVPSQGVTA